MPKISGQITCGTFGTHAAGEFHHLLKDEYTNDWNVSKVCQEHGVSFGSHSTPHVNKDPNNCCYYVDSRLSDDRGNTLTLKRCASKRHLLVNEFSMSIDNDFLVRVGHRSVPSSLLSEFAAVEAATT